MQQTSHVAAPLPPRRRLRHRPAAAPLRCGACEEPSAQPQWSRVATSLFLAATLLVSPLDSGATTDTKAVGQCLLSGCQTQLAACIADEKCAENLVCLAQCSGTPNEAACQIRCGDLYADTAVKNFNTCAVTTKKCVPQRANANEYPPPPPGSLVSAFDTADFTGRWYISAGLNPLFDTFDCQAHFFTSPEPGKLFGKINWRVERPNGQFYERSDLQRFIQDPANPAVLYNHDNAMLHYEDDWYVVAFKPEAYALIYYRGRNDAWDGYGGAVVYTRAPELSSRYVPELEAAAAKVGLRWSDFKESDNTCGPEPKLRVARPADLDTLADDAKALLPELEDELVSFSRNFTLLKGAKAQGAKLGQFLSREEAAAAAELQRAEATLLQLEAEAVEPLRGPLAALLRFLGLAQ